MPIGLGFLPGMKGATPAGAWAPQPWGRSRTPEMSSPVHRGPSNSQEQAAPWGLSLPGEGPECSGGAGWEDRKWEKRAGPGRQALFVSPVLCELGNVWQADSMASIPTCCPSATLPPGGGPTSAPSGNALTARAFGSPLGPTQDLVASGNQCLCGGISVDLVVEKQGALHPPRSPSRLFSSDPQQRNA